MRNFDLLRISDPVLRDREKLIRQLNESGIGEFTYSTGSLPARSRVVVLASLLFGAGWVLVQYENSGIQTIWDLAIRADLLVFLGILLLVGYGVKKDLLLDLSENVIRARWRIFGIPTGVTIARTNTIIAISSTWQSQSESPFSSPMKARAFLTGGPFSLMMDQFINGIGSSKDETALALALNDGQIVLLTPFQNIDLDTRNEQASILAAWMNKPFVANNFNGKMIMTWDAGDERFILQHELLENEGSWITLVRGIGLFGIVFGLLGCMLLWEHFSQPLFFIAAILVIIVIHIRAGI